MDIKTELNSIMPEDWAAFAVGDVAFVKPVLINNIVHYSVHAADGTPLTVLPNRDVAEAAIRQNGLEPASVH